ncbi:MAG TPA: hypothetical protein VFZ79_12635, partial [Acidimicrobiales bacterium]
MASDTSDRNGEGAETGDGAVGDGEPAAGVAVRVNGGGAEDRDRRPTDSGRGYHLEIFLISFAALLLEISYTRIVSFKLFYYYTYLVIGLALLGIGTGSVVVSLSKRLRRASTDAVMMVGSLLGALSIIAGYLVVARLPVASLAIWDYGSRDSVENLVKIVIL